MQDYFYSLADSLFHGLQGDELLLLYFNGEDSDFVRLNHHLIRQAGSVSQRTLSLDLIDGQRHARASIELTGNIEQDLAQVTVMLTGLREQLGFLPEDPYLYYPTDIVDTGYHHDNEVINSHQAIEQVIAAAGDLDLVGIFANGTQYAGFASSLGQRNWHSSATFNFDWSCYLSSEESGDEARDKAVKSNYAGFEWQPDVMSTKIDSARHQLERLTRAPRTIDPGEYRAYLSPSAVSEIISMMAWGGFGLKSHRTRNTPLLKMVEAGQTLADGVTLREHNARGLAPIFTSSGFIKPDDVLLIDSGKYRDCLVSARSAKEFDTGVNADWEYPGSLEMTPGTLQDYDILGQLDTGLYINNLWYLNFTDRNNCQLTGMTRFACFWVEDGKIVAPLNVMRFDDSVYKLLGDNLVDLTAQRELLLDPGTYGGRSNHSMELPGMLVKSLRLTL